MHEPTLVQVCKRVQKLREEVELDRERLPLRGLADGRGVCLEIHREERAAGRVEAVVDGGDDVRVPELREEEELALDELRATDDRARMARQPRVLRRDEVVRGHALQRDEATVQTILRPVHHAGRASAEKGEATVAPRDPPSRRFVSRRVEDRADLAGSRRLGRQGAHARARG